MCSDIAVPCAKRLYVGILTERMIARDKAGTDNFSERARTRKSLPTSLCSVRRMDFEFSMSGY